MKHFKIVEVPAQPATTEEVLDYISCEICGREIQPMGEWFEDEVDIVRNTSRGGPHGGQGRTYKIDMCPGCFEEKLIPWVRSFGGDARVGEYDW